MNKRFIRLLGTAVVALTITSCNTTKEVDVSRVGYVAPTALRLNRYAMGLVAGSSKTLEAKLSPSVANSICKVTYTSSDTSVARVDSNGVVTGVSGGAAVITVTAGEGDDAISQEVPVYVGNSATKSEAQTRANEQLTMQQALGRPSAIQVHEVRDTYTKVSGVDQKGYSDDCLYTVSEPDGLIDLDGYERVLKTAEGNKEPVRYAWTFMTDADYITHLYHISGSTKNRMSLPTQSYIGQPRVQVVYDLVDMIFTRGKKAIVDQNYDTVYETENLEEVSGKNFGTFKSDDLNIVVYTYTGGGNLNIDPDDESNYEIPANTSTRVSLSIDLCYVNGVCVSEAIIQDMSYKLDDGISYVKSYVIDYASRINGDVVVNKPNNKDYSEVDDLYDL